MQLNSASQLIEVLKNDYFCSYVSPKTSEFQCFDSGITFQQVGFGSMMAIRDSLGKNTCGSTLIKNDGDLVKPRAMQWVVFDKSGVRYLAAHLHGVWLKENTKGDDPIRMRQSEQVLKVISGLVIKHKVSKVIFGGDLNLAPDTEALKMLLSGTKAENLSRNLISEYKIRSTRTPLYRKYNDEGTELLADYVLTSSNVEVESLKVGSDVPVSDHMPLLLKFY
jgi:endonuclease/exonuclease/phosphatase family metal-dependent hydrolase